MSNLKARNKKSTKPILKELDPDQLVTKIGYGRTSEVFRLKDDRIVKLLSPRVSFKRAEHELKCVKMASEAGIPVWRVESLVTCQSRIGMVGESLPKNTMSLALRLLHRPWEFSLWFKEFVSLHKQINETSGECFPPIKGYLRRRIRSSKIPEFMMEAALSRLEQLPDGDRMCHGDLHPANLLVVNKRLLAIDWASAGSGPPSYDVARSAFLLNYGSASGKLHWLTRPVGRYYAKCYVRERLKTENMSWKTLEEWLLPLLASRLVRRADKERNYFEQLIYKEAF